MSSANPNWIPGDLSDASQPEEPRENPRTKCQESKQAVIKAEEELWKWTEQGLQVPVGHLQYLHGTWELHSSDYLGDFITTSKSEVDFSPDVNSSISSDRPNLDSHQQDQYAATSQQDLEPPKHGMTANKLQSSDTISDDQQTKHEDRLSTKPVAKESRTSQINKMASIALDMAEAAEKAAVLTGNDIAIAEAEKNKIETEEAAAVVRSALFEAMTIKEQALSVAERAQIFRKSALALDKASLAMGRHVLAMKMEALVLAKQILAMEVKVKALDEQVADVEKEDLAVQKEALAIRKRVLTMEEAVSAMGQQAEAKKEYAHCKIKQYLPAELHEIAQVITDTKGQGASLGNKEAEAKPNAAVNVQTEATSNGRSSEDKVAREQQGPANDCHVEMLDSELASEDCPAETNQEIVFAMNKILVRIGPNSTPLTFDFEIPQYASLDPFPITDDKTGVKMDLTILGNGFLKLALDSTYLGIDKSGRIDSSDTNKITFYGVFKKRG